MSPAERLRRSGLAWALVAAMRRWTPGIVSLNGGDAAVREVTDAAADALEALLAGERAPEPPEVPAWVMQSLAYQFIHPELRAPEQDAAISSAREWIAGNGTVAVAELRVVRLCGSDVRAIVQPADAPRAEGLALGSGDAASAEKRVARVERDLDAAMNAIRVAFAALDEEAVTHDDTAKERKLVGAALAAALTAARSSRSE